MIQGPLLFHPHSRSRNRFPSLMPVLALLTVSSALGVRPVLGSLFPIARLSAECFFGVERPAFRTDQQSSWTEGPYGVYLQDGGKGSPNELPSVRMGLLYALSPVPFVVIGLGQILIVLARRLPLQESQGREVILALLLSFVSATGVWAILLGFPIVTLHLLGLEVGELPWLEWAKPFPLSASVFAALLVTWFLARRSPSCRNGQAVVHEVPSPPPNSPAV